MKVMGNTTYYDRECVTSIKYFPEEGTIVISEKEIGTS